LPIQTQKIEAFIHRGFEEAMTAHMGTIAYRENRKTFWDKEKQVIV
jgi:hypothetical protein